MLLQLLLIWYCLISTLNGRPCEGGGAANEYQECTFNQPADVAGSCAVHNANVGGNAAGYCGTSPGGTGVRKLLAPGPGGPNPQWNPGVGGQCKIKCGPVVKTRIRRSWYRITDQERQRFANAVKALDAFGQLRPYVVSHHTKQWHYHLDGHYEFFPYHRGLLYRFESAVRALGDMSGVGGYDFRDFTIPYWDHTHHLPWYIVNQGFSHLGSVRRTTPNPTQCLNTGMFASNANNPDGWVYRPADNGAGNCLKRAADITRNPFQNPYATWSYILQADEYGLFCQGGGCRSHTDGHNQVGGGGATGSQISDQGWSPADPIFWLHHAYVDYLWAGWQTIHNFQTTSNTRASYKNKHDGNGPDPTTTNDFNPDFGNGPLNNEMDYTGIFDHSWSKKTARSMMQLRSGGLDLSQYDNIQYERTNFFTNVINPDMGWRVGFQFGGGLVNEYGPAAGPGAPLPQLRGDQNQWFVAPARRRRLVDDNYDYNTYNNGTRRKLPGELATVKNDDGTGIMEKKKLQPQTMHILKNPDIKFVVVKEKVPKIPEAKCDAYKKEKVEQFIKQNTKTKGKMTAQEAQKIISDLSTEACKCMDQQNCKAPKGIKECLEWVQDAETWDAEKRDIKVTDEELLGRKGEDSEGITECQKQTIKDYYGWAQATHSKLKLCMGCFDNVCSDPSATYKNCQLAIALGGGEKEPTDLQHTHPVFNNYGEYHSKKHHEDDGYIETKRHYDDDGNAYGSKHKYKPINYPNNYVNYVNYHNDGLNLLFLTFFSIIMILLICCCVACVFGTCIGGAVYHLYRQIIAGTKDGVHKKEIEQV